MMRRLNPLRFASRSGKFVSLTRLDWFALFLSTASVLLFAASMLISTPRSGSVITSLKNASWLHTSIRDMTVDTVLLIFLVLEVLLLLWLWVEFPRRRRTEDALRKINSLQRAIARSSARIVSLTSTEIVAGLHSELSSIREMLGVDRICWYQQSPDGGRFMRLQTASSAPNVPGRESFSAIEHPWLADSIVQGVPVLVKSLSEMPAGSEVDRQQLEPSGMRSFALVPSIGGTGIANAMMLTSFTNEIEWDPEVVAQLSVLASVFANAHVRKLAQEAGTESELRFRHLFEEAPIGCCLVDSEGRICTTNTAFARMLGYNPEELFQKGFWEITEPRDVARSLVNFQELIAGVRDFYQLEKRYLKKDGAVIWGRLTVSVLGARAAQGPFVLAMIEDVTEAIHAREQLEQSRRRLTMALEASRMTAWEYDPATETIAWVDRNTLREKGNEPMGPVRFADVLRHVHPDERTMLLDLANRIINEGGSFSSEFRMFAKNGSIRWMLGKGELLRNEGEAGPGKIAGVTLDVSELKRTQVELQELAKRLMEAHEEERRRISRELHDDIGQRVALLGIELDLVRQLLHEHHALRERVERAQLATGELGTDLHQLSHALHSSKLKYLGLPAALRELCTRMADKHSLAIQLDCDEQKLSLPEEEALALFRVAQEALNNVVRHSRATSVRVALNPTASEVRLLVCDDGSGFDPSSKTSGIGLIGMRERMRAVMGDFQIISAPGGGTEIHATVSFAAPARDQLQIKKLGAGTVQ
jgi:PAS domain S-box-containing protein